MRKKIASFESFLFGQNGKNSVLEWLSSDQPKQLAKHVRNFAADDLNVEKVRGVLKEIVTRALGQATRRLDVDTRFLREFGTIAAKDVMSVNDFLQIENQSEEKLDKVREPAAKFAHTLLK